MKAKSRHERRLLRQFRKNRPRRGRLLLAAAGVGTVLVLHWTSGKAGTEPASTPPGPASHWSVIDGPSIPADNELNPSTDSTRYLGPTVELDTYQAQPLHGPACPADTTGDKGDRS